MSTIDEQISCVQREIKMRKRVYSRKVEQGTMSKEKARKELNLMKDVHFTLQQEKVRREGKQSTLFNDTPKPKKKNRYEPE